MAISRLRFKATNNGTYYIDLAKALSLQERRMHRQKAIYTVYGGFFVDSQGNRIDINTAPMTWPVKRAVNRGFAMWRRHTAMALQDSQSSSKSKYRDYKVLLNNDMASATVLEPLDAADKNLYNNTVEWDYATLYTEDPFEDPVTGVTQTPDNFDLHIVGPHVGNNQNWLRVGLVQSWINSRPAPLSPAPNDIPDVTDPLVNLFDSSDALDERLTNVNNEGDQPPYDEDVVFGNAVSPLTADEDNLQRMSVAIPGANPVAPVHGFQALCGLLQLVVGSDTATNQWELVLDVETKGEQF